MNMKCFLLMLFFTVVPSVIAIDGGSSNSDSESIEDLIEQVSQEELNDYDETLTDAVLRQLKRKASSSSKLSNLFGVQEDDLPVNSTDSSKNSNSKDSVGKASLIKKLRNKFSRKS